MNRRSYLVKHTVAIRQLTLPQMPNQHLGAAPACAALNAQPGVSPRLCLLCGEEGDPSSPTRKHGATFDVCLSASGELIFDF